MATWLCNRKARNADELAAKAVQAAEGQHTSVPGEDMTALVVHSLAIRIRNRRPQGAAPYVRGPRPRPSPRGPPRSLHPELGEEFRPGTLRLVEHPTENG